MKFNEYCYIRPNVEDIKTKVETLITRFENSSSVEEQFACYDELRVIFNTVDTMGNLAFIRHSINTNDEFYEKEQSFFDEKGPLFQEMGNHINQMIINSQFRPDLEARYGKYLFEKIELQLKTFKPEIIDDLVQENKLVTKYSKILASAKIDFEGGIRNLSQMTAFTQSSNRDVRRRSQLVVAGFLSENEEELDLIYDELVHIRANMAKKLGFNNYVELGYARLGRTDYGPEEVANYRKQVLKDIVPVCQKLIKRQQERLGLDDFKYYDLNLKFLSGNAKPIGDRDYLVDQAQHMYGEMSKETKEFFDFMVEHELLDLEAKPGKQGGGYCTFIFDYKSPFIFSNFNGTSGDIDVLTHEAGHAFQVFQSRNFDIPEYMWPTYEACEIHSMSMEFFAWPWMKQFFGDDEPKYKYAHLSEALLFVPYGVTVDEFQHFVYNNPNVTPDERKAKWREIERMYLPYKEYEGNPFFEKGGWWFRQGHIFSTPFYYIDYTLAQMCALQYFLRSRKDRKEAWDSYVKLCQLGGSKPFLALVEAAGLKNPFVDGTIKKISQEVEVILATMDDKKM
ncbi:MAG: M3 family oligoendopeptidase [Bacilli bacterium]